MPTSPDPSDASSRERGSDQAVTTPAAELLARYRDVRAQTMRLCAPLAVEDYVLQCMAEASPTRWHIAHTTWFFERFILQEHVAHYAPFDPQYYFLFNSYYQALGPRHARAKRGDLSRPTVGEIRTYRNAVDQRMEALLRSAERAVIDRIAPILTLGLHHEQQHQELILTDLKVNLAQNPLRPVYRDLPEEPTQSAVDCTWIPFEEGVREIGTDGPGFYYDNEGPRHRVYVPPVALASRPATNGEYLAFVEDGGYEKPEYWLDLGYARVRAEDWRHPLYWFRDGDRWMEYTLGGARPLDPAEPVCHLSYFEADAFARWTGFRLPTEAEWEVAAAGLDPTDGHFADDARHQPRPATAGPGLRQMFGTVWEWTSSSYGPYPNYRTPEGAVGEYNAKFMCNQYVLRGGSLATPPEHVRATYRNFFPPESRWQFAGVRLAKDLR